MSSSSVYVCMSSLLVFCSTVIQPRSAGVAGCCFVPYPGLQPGVSDRVHEQLSLASNRNPHWDKDSFEYGIIDVDKQP